MEEEEWAFQRLRMAGAAVLVLAGAQLLEMVHAGLMRGASAVAGLLEKSHSHAVHCHHGAGNLGSHSLDRQRHAAHCCHPDVGKLGMHVDRHRHAAHHCHHAACKLGVWSTSVTDLAGVAGEACRAHLGIAPDLPELSVRTASAMAEPSVSHSHSDPVLLGAAVLKAPGAWKAEGQHPGAVQLESAVLARRP